MFDPAAESSAKPRKIIEARPIFAPPAVPSPIAPALQPLAPPADPMTLPALSRGVALVPIAAIVTVILLAPLAVILLAPRDWVADAVGNYQPAFIVGLKIFEACVALLLTLLLLKVCRLPAASFGIRLRGLGTQLGWGLLTLAACYFYLFGSALVIGMLVERSSAARQDVLERVEFMRSLPAQSLWGVVLLLVPVAVHEELLFRGLLVPYFRRLTGRWWAAVLLPALIFGALHFNQGWLAIAQISGLGMVFGLFFLLSRSVLAVIVAHFLFDFLQIQLFRVLGPYAEKFLQGGG